MVLKTLVAPVHIIIMVIIIITRLMHDRVFIVLSVKYGFHFITNTCVIEYDTCTYS